MRPSRHPGPSWAQALIALVLLLFGAAGVQAQSFPPFTGLVVDAANVIPDDREPALVAKLQALRRDTGRQLVVATIPDLQGYPVEDYGYQLGRAWGVGLKDANNGAILIVAPKDRRVRVEVGYGLEPILTDAFSSAVINQVITPAFRNNDMAGGIDAGVDALITQLRLPDAEALAKAKQAAAEYDKAHRQRSGGGGVPLPLIFWGLVILFILLSMFRGGGGGGRRFRGGRGPVILWGPGFGGGFGGGGGGSGGGSSGGGGWMGGGGFSGGGGGSFGGGGASGSW